MNNQKDKKSIVEKLSIIRKELQERDIKKSGRNAFVGFKYYELNDILGHINELNAKYGVVDVINLYQDRAVLTLTDGEEMIDFEVPFENFEGQQKMLKIQQFGSNITYYRRYLYLLAYNISEYDVVDRLDQADNSKRIAETEAEYRNMLRDCKNKAEAIELYHKYKGVLGQGRAAEIGKEYTKSKEADNGQA